MTDKNTVKDFIVAIANDDYIQADKAFPKVIDSSLKKIINNRKPEVLKALSAEAEKIAQSSIEKKADTKKE